MKIIYSKLKTKEIVSIFLMLCILVGITLHITPYFYNRSLWINEAMLAGSICTRSFSELAASPLDWGQSSPIGYLYIEKLIITIFGTSEAPLRIFSLAAAFGCIAFVYLLLRNKVKNNYALLITAIFSLTDGYIYYGNELKPYMSDNLCCLITLFIWQKFNENKIKLWQMAVAFSILIWFSFSAVFFIAACMVIECIRLFKNLIKNRDNKAIIKLGICAVVLVSFILNYAFWLSKTSDNADGADYWALLRFPLLPASMSDIKLIWKMVLQFFAFYPYSVVMVFIILLLVYIVICINKKIDKSQLVLPFTLSLLALFAASYCGFYPIQDRLVQVYAIIVIIIAGYGCDETDKYLSNYEGKRQFIYKRILGVVLAACLAIVGRFGCKNLFARNVYTYGSEVTESIRYLEENITNDDVIYVYRSSIPVYIYETGYKVLYSDLEALSENESDEMLSGLPYQIGNTIYGQSLSKFDYKVPYSYDYKNNDAAINEDSQLILKNNSVYLFTSHIERGIPQLIEILEEYGSVETVVDSYNTHLYHFKRSK